MVLRQSGADDALITQQRRRVLSMVEVLTAGLRVRDAAVLAAGIYLYVINSPTTLHWLTPRAQEIGRRAWKYIHALAGKGDCTMAEYELHRDRDAYLVCMADQFIRMQNVAELTEETAGDLYRNLRDTLVPLRKDAPEVAELFEPVLVQGTHLAAAPLPDKPAQPLPMPMFGSLHVNLDISEEAPDEPGLQNWSTVQHVVTYCEKELATMEYTRLGLALQWAENTYGKCPIVGAIPDRTGLAHCVRRLEVLLKGLKVRDGRILAASALLYCCRGGLKTSLRISSMSGPRRLERFYRMIGGDHTARIAEKAYIINGFLPDGSIIQVGSQAYKDWLDSLAHDVEALIVLLSDQYAFGELLPHLGAESRRNIWTTTVDALALAKGIEGVDEVFDPWLEKYGPLVQA